MSLNFLCLSFPLCETGMILLPFNKLERIKHGKRVEECLVIAVPSANGGGDVWLMGVCPLSRAQISRDSPGSLLWFCPSGMAAAYHSP